MPLHQTHKPPIVILTGFGPFPGVTENVSINLAGAVCEVLNNQAHSDFKAVTATLAVDWSTVADHLTALYAKHTPILAVHFGVAHGIAGLCLEETAQNTCAPDLDAAGHKPNAATVQARGQGSRSTKLPITELISDLGLSDILIQPSQDAGRYLCNAAYYTSLSLAHNQAAPSDALFVHIPADLQPTSARWEKFVAASVRIVQLAANSQR